jgi:hypothetical protein
MGNSPATTGLFFLSLAKISMDLSSLVTIYFIVAGACLLTVIFTLIYIHRRKDFSKVVKLLWTFIIILAPILGLIAYFIWATGKESDVRRSGER